MFYTTTIKSICGDGVTDTQGRYLRFIGDLPVNEGDRVYTDGKVIFGNVPHKGSPAVFLEQSGIPVFCYKDSGDGEKEEVRGYFTKRGSFNKYKIADDDWITNSDKKFAHGEEKFNDELVIDATITDNGDKFIVTDGFYRKCETATYNNHLFNIVTRYMQKTIAATGEVIASDHKFIVEIRPIVGQEVTLGADADDIDKPVTIYRNGEKSSEVHLNEYAEKAVEECWRCYAELTENPMDTDVTAFVDWQCVHESDPVNFIKQPPPPDPFIALSYSRVECFRVDQNGNWDAVIAAAAYGHCFLNITLPCSLFYRLFEDGKISKEFSESLLWCVDDLETAIFDEKLYPFLEIEQYPEFEGTEKNDNGEYTEEFKKYVEDKLAYYIPLVRFKHYKWEPFIFSSQFRFHVRNGKIINTVIGASGGGNAVQISEAWDEENYYGQRLFAHSTPARPSFELYNSSNYDVFEENDLEFPLEDGYFLCGKDYELREVKKNGKKAFTIPSTMRDKLDGFDEGETTTILYSDIVYPREYWFLYDEKALELAGVNQDVDPADSLILRQIYHRYIPVFTDINNEKNINDYLKDDDKKIYYPIWVHLSAGTDDGWYRFNPSIAELAGKQYLFGFHDNELRLVDTKSDAWDKTKKIGDELKNFRLRELKKINKAKT